MQGRIKVVAAVLAAFLIEIFGFNFSNVLAVVGNAPIAIDLNGNLIENKEYDGQGVEWFVDMGSVTKIYNITVGTDSACSPVFFYTNHDGTIVRNDFFALRQNCYGLKLNKEISGILGISTYNGAHITDMTINKPEIMFSWARVVAMMLIYFFGSFLFSIQKMPDYGIDADNQGN